MTDSPAPRWFLARPLWAAAVVYLALRALVLWTNFDGVSLPNYELTTLGNLAKVLSEGWRGVPLIEHYDNCGGQIVGGVLGVPLYAVFGDSFLTLKLVPVLLGLCAMFLSWWILERCASRRAAIVGVFLFALTPPTLVKYSMIACGNHFENLFFQLAAWALFLRAHSRAANPRWLFAWALAAGFAVFVSLDCIFLVAILFLVHFAIRGPRRALRDAVVIVPGLVLGLVPLIWVQYASRGSVSGFLGGVFAAHESGVFARFFGRLFDLWTNLLPRAGVFESSGPISRNVAEALYLAAFLLAWTSLAFVLVRGLMALRASFRDEETCGESGDALRLSHLMYAPLVLYLPCFSASYAASAMNFDLASPPVEVFEFRYLVPHFLFSSMLIGVASARWIACGGWKRVLGGTLATLTLSTAVCTLPIVDWSFARAGSGRLHAGYDYEFYANLMLKDLRWNPERENLDRSSAQLAKSIAEFPEEADNHLWFAVASRAAQIEFMRSEASGSQEIDPIPVLHIFDLDSGHSIDLARGVGSALRRIAQTRRAAKMDEVARWVVKLAESNDPRVAFVVEGLCLPYGARMQLWTEFDLNLDLELRAKLPRSLIGAHDRGEGFACGRLDRRGIAGDQDQVRAFIDALPPDAVADFWFGFGGGLAAEGLGPRSRAALDAILPRADRGALFAGIGAELRHVFGPSDSRARASDLRAQENADDRAALDRGLEWSNYPLPFVR